jgi:hypothetical protein
VTLRLLKVLALALGLVMATVARAEPPAIVQQEINHLIRHVGDSGCEFRRNDLWSNAKAAEAHVRGKYDFLVAVAHKPRYFRALQLALLAFADLIADQAADRGTAHRTERAAARKDRTPEGTYAGANRGVLVPRRHPAATTQAEQHCCGNRTDCKSLHRFHWNTFFRHRLTANLSPLRTLRHWTG